MEKVVKQGYHFETRPTRCKMSEEDHSLTLDVVKDPLWVDVKAARRLKELATPMPDLLHQWYRQAHA